MKFLIFLALLITPAQAEETTGHISLTVVTPVSLEDCLKDPDKEECQNIMIIHDEGDKVVIINQ